jgi:hypothetical protein
MTQHSIAAQELPGVSFLWYSFVKKVGFVRELGKEEV